MAVEAAVDPIGDSKMSLIMVGPQYVIIAASKRTDFHFSILQLFVSHFAPIGGKRETKGNETGNEQETKRHSPRETQETSRKRASGNERLL